MAVGQPTFATSLHGGDTPQDGNYVWEWWYKLQVTDNIAITPALFWLSRARGALTNAGASAASALADPGISDGDTLGTFGGLIQTTFRF